jgi:putative ABC transport system substrate-binding protein
MATRRAAQKPERVRHVGVLMPTPEGDPFTRAIVTAFADALQQFGWMQSKNIRVDYRFAAGDPKLFKSYAAKLVGLAPDTILASTTPAIEALSRHTRTIPIVFVLGVDPVGRGWVQSLARPGGNLTGFISWDAPLMGKWLQLLKETAPGVMRVTVIFNPDTAPFAPFLSRAIEDAAPTFGMAVTLAPVHDDAGIEEAIGAEAREPGGCLISLPDSFNTTHRDVIIAAAARHRLPLIGPIEVPRDGGLISYTFDPVEQHAQVDRILRGASPADLPVQQPTRYSLIINLKTAKALGLTVPQNLLLLADEVIE